MNFNINLNTKLLVKLEVNICKYLFILYNIKDEVMNKFFL